MTDLTTALARLDCTKRHVKDLEERIKKLETQFIEGGGTADPAAYHYLRGIEHRITALEASITLSPVQPYFQRVIERPVSEHDQRR